MDLFIQLLIAGILVGAVYGLMALGIVVIYKTSGVFNIAVGQCVALGCFIGWALLVQVGLPLPLMIVGLLVSAFVIAVAIERFLMRPLTGQPLISSVMVVIALMEVFAGFIALVWPGAGRLYPPVLPTGVIRLGQVAVSVELLINFAICILTFAIFMAFFRFTKTGLVMRAASEDKQLAQSGGIAVTNMVMMAWFIALVTASIGGILLGNLYGANLGSIAGMGLMAFAAVMLGGFESIQGALLGGLVVGVAASLGAGYLDVHVEGGMAELIPFIIILVILLVKPYGLFGYERIERV